MWPEQITSIQDQVITQGWDRPFKWHRIKTFGPVRVGRSGQTELILGVVLQTRNKFVFRTEEHQCGCTSRELSPRLTVGACALCICVQMRLPRGVAVGPDGAAKVKAERANEGPGDFCVSFIGDFGCASLGGWLQFSMCC